MKIIRDERTQNIIEVIFNDNELDAKDSIMASLAQMEQARYHVAEINIEKNAEVNMRNSDNQKETQMDCNKRIYDAQMDYNKRQYESALDYNRRSQQLAYMYQFPGVTQLPNFN